MQKEGDTECTYLADLLLAQLAARLLYLRLLVMYDNRGKGKVIEQWLVAFFA